jgi:hypothetical protein
LFAAHCALAWATPEPLITRITRGERRLSSVSAQHAVPRRLQLEAKAPHQEFSEQPLDVHESSILATAARLATSTRHHARADSARSTMMIAHIPPTLWSHVNVYGKYEFDVDAGTPPEWIATASPTNNRIRIACHA